ncbi:hypothetical protein [Pseudofrankia sp. BMG5.36]|uniref:hypothetical protein n=1 Tax=Pseudofrankia sp. BMG5.36 TaxID=1834512 RepID=UPI0008DA5A27|nr:hypothetical protein [Pseudofrankia sp. BMG5.36]OHV64167.1 hypothetical protein BCD48_37580 [Pseudofrankia sp. BMG5.36]
MGWLGNLFGTGIASGIQDVLRALIEVLVGAFRDRTRDLLTELFATSTRPQVTASSYLAGDGPYHTVATFSGALLVGALLVGVIQGLLSGEPGQAFARMFRQLPVAVLGIAGLPWLVDRLLTIADALAGAVLPADTAATLTDRMALPPSQDAPGLLLTLVVFVGGVLLYMELIVRDSLVLIVVALAPLSLAASVLPAARAAAGQVTRMVVAAVLAKPAIFVALRIGIDQLNEGPNSDGAAGWGQYLLGLTTVVVAVFMPTVVWRLIPIVEAYTLAQGLSRAPFRAAQQTAQVAYWGRALGGAARLGGGRGAGAGRGVGGGRGAGGGLPGGDAPTPTAGNGPIRPRSLPDPPTNDTTTTTGGGPGPSTGPATGPTTGRGAGPRPGPATGPTAGRRPGDRPPTAPRPGEGRSPASQPGPGQAAAPRRPVRPQPGPQPRRTPPPLAHPGGAATSDPGR